MLILGSEMALQAIFLVRIPVPGSVVGMTIVGYLLGVPYLFYATRKKWWPANGHAIGALYAPFVPLYSIAEDIILAPYYGYKSDFETQLFRTLLLGYPFFAILGLVVCAVNLTINRKMGVVKWNPTSADLSSDD